MESYLFYIEILIILIVIMVGIQGFSLRRDVVSEAVSNYGPSLLLRACKEKNLV